MHIRIRLITYVWMLLCLLATACTSIGFELPQGPQGPDGKSAYDLWKEEVEAGRINCRFPYANKAESAVRSYT